VVQVATFSGEAAWSRHLNFRDHLSRALSRAPSSMNPRRKNSVAVKSLAADPAPVQSQH
jgi:hypothetical protein